MGDRSQLDHNSALTLHSAAASLPAPSGAGDGGDLATWGSAPTDQVLLTIDVDGACTITDGELCGYDATDSKWRSFALLKSGLGIAMTATLGYAEKFSGIGIFSRLAVTGTVSANNVTIKIKRITPIG